MHRCSSFGPINLQLFSSYKVIMWGLHVWSRQLLKFPLLDLQQGYEDRYDLVLCPESFRTDPAQTQWLMPRWWHPVCLQENVSHTHQECISATSSMTKHDCLPGLHISEPKWTALYVCYRPHLRAEGEDRFTSSLSISMHPPRTAPVSISTTLSDFDKEVDTEVHIFLSLTSWNISCARMMDMLSHYTSSCFYHMHLDI